MGFGTDLTAARSTQIAVCYFVVSWLHCQGVFLGLVCGEESCMHCRCSVTSCLSRAAMVTERKKDHSDMAQNKLIQILWSQVRAGFKLGFSSVYFRPIARTRLHITCREVKCLGSLAETQGSRRTKWILLGFFGESLRSLYKVWDWRWVTGPNKEVLTVFWAVMFF